MEARTPEEEEQDILVVVQLQLAEKIIHINIFHKEITRHIIKDLFKSKILELVLSLYHKQV